MDLFCTTVSRARGLKRAYEPVIRLRNEVFDAAVARSVRRDPPAAVVAYDSSSLKTFKAAKRQGVVCVLDQVVGHLASGVRLLREEAALHPDFADSLPSIVDRIVRRCTEEALLADHVLVPSDYVRRTMEENGVAPSRISIVPYGADVSRFRPADGPRERSRPVRFLFMGQITQRKGVKYLLEAFRRLRLPNAELVLMGQVIGSGRGLAPYRDSFRHVEAVPYADLPAYYADADVFVFPSLHEGSAMVVYEAMASGLPVIVTPNAGTAATDGREGFVVPIRDVEALMARMETLYREPSRRDEMGRIARTTALSYTWANYARRLSEVISPLL